ncbi:hypothetical protein BDW22DRAFT_700989 [Trametopsis cervina]|nr:hypothetical protein BDW22DRAFT_700989 [Trametopsis cervina]
MSMFTDFYSLFEGARQVVCGTHPCHAEVLRRVAMSDSLMSGGRGGAYELGRVCSNLRPSVGEALRSVPWSIGYRVASQFLAVSAGGADVCHYEWNQSQASAAGSSSPGLPYLNYHHLASHAPLFRGAVFPQGIRSCTLMIFLHMYLRRIQTH